MANSITNVGFTDFATEQGKIDRQRKLAEALTAQGMAPAELPQTPPGGFTPHMSWAQGLGKMAQAYVGALQNKKADEQQKALSQEYQQATSGDVASLIKALQGRPAHMIQPDPQEAQQSADYGTPEVGPVNIPAQTPTEALTSALPNMRTPVGQQLASSYLTNAIASPEKFGHDPKIEMVDGAPHAVTYGDKGTRKDLGPVTPRDKTEFVQAGGTTVGVNPYSPPGTTIAHTMTPDAQANLAFKQYEYTHLSANQRAQLDAELEKIGISKQQLAEGRVQLMQDNDGNVFAVNKVTRTGAPVGQEGGGLLKIQKPMTESQANANIFGTRAEAAHKIMSGLENNISTTGLAIKRGAENIPLIGGTAGAIGNAALSPQQQQVEQAQRDFVNAVLRKESGASISPSEFQNAIKQYFPQPGDSPQVKAQKRANREIEIAGLMAAAGKAPNHGGSPVVSNPQANQPFAAPQAKTISWNDLK